MSPEQPQWRRFEQAVAAFAAALDPSATVKHDVRMPDRHHGRSRQRDVWIDAKIAGHFPVSILVSCKRTKRKLNSGDLDAFCGELSSSPARVGVLYSYAGFTQGAVEKGRVLGIPCCRLYAGKGPEIPTVLSFSSYCCVPRIQLSLAELPTLDGLATWADVFALRFPGEGTEVSLLDRLVGEYHQAEKQSVQVVAGARRFPEAFGFTLVAACKEPTATLHITVRGSWRFYRANVEAYDVNGSYEFTKGDFKGSVATPAIDRFASNPGPGWDSVDKPSTMVGTVALFILFGGAAKDTLAEKLGPQLLQAANNALQPTGANALLSAGG
jgi:hypothetical protein